MAGVFFSEDFDSDFEELLDDESDELLDEESEELLEELESFEDSDLDDADSAAFSRARRLVP